MRRRSLGTRVCFPSSKYPSEQRRQSQKKLWPLLEKGLRRGLIVRQGHWTGCAHTGRRDLSRDRGGSPGTCEGSTQMTTMRCRKPTRSGSSLDVQEMTVVALALRRIDQTTLQAKLNEKLHQVFPERTVESFKGLRRNKDSMRLTHQTAMWHPMKQKMWLLTLMKDKAHS